MKNIFKYTLVVLSLLLFRNCSVSRSGEEYVQVGNIEEELKAAIETNESDLEELDQLRKQAEKSYKESKITRNTHDEIVNFVESEREILHASTKALERSLVRVFQKTVITKSALSKSEEALSSQSRSSEMRKNKMRLTDEMIHMETLSKTEIGAIFQLGQYELNSTQRERAILVFTPIIDNMYTFIEKYDGTISEFLGEIEIIGYSDGTVIQKGSALYSNLTKMMEGTRYTNADLNRKLSELRANSLKALLLEVIENQRPSRGDRIKVVIHTAGKGEELPPGIKGNKANDPNRRVVTFQWAVLPK